MATHSHILGRIIPWTEEPDWLQFMGLQKRQTRLRDRALEELYSSIHFQLRKWNGRI